jgi:hypothetical protein
LHAYFGSSSRFGTELADLWTSRPRLAGKSGSRTAAFRVPCQVPAILRRRFSVFDSALIRIHNAKWLFHQEKATLHDVCDVDK